MTALAITLIIVQLICLFRWHVERTADDVTDVDLSEIRTTYGWISIVQCACIVFIMLAKLVSE